MLLEVIAISVSDVRDAVRFGAERIELVTGISEGGLTPSAGLVEGAVKVAGAVPVNVMIRPHARSFVYDEFDLAVMERDIELARRAGAAGIVFGALTPGGEVDAYAVKRLIAAGAGLDATFHRAFDEARDPFEALEALSAFPSISRVLTSGGLSPAPRSIPRIRELVGAAARTHLRILAGHGLTPEGLEAFVRETGAAEVHFGSGVREDGTFRTRIDARKMAVVRGALR
ncbi:copper homeostasis protein CutC [Paenibacillus sp.]|uniref:copper homeostasis protein CutC n=1 Tax=Paenibacillus sp. TaxID=58172 RepID=UPI00281122AC|nr:copper homeostasis protein CutC [Paenibacillus sp.]